MKQILHTRECHAKPGSHVGCTCGGADIEVPTWITPVEYVDRDELRRRYCPTCKGTGVTTEPGHMFNSYDDDGNGLGYAIEEEIPCPDCTPETEP